MARTDLFQVADLALDRHQLCSLTLPTHVRDSSRALDLEGAQYLQQHMMAEVVSDITTYPESEAHVAVADVRSVSSDIA